MMRQTRSAVAALGLLLGATPALADYFIRDGNNVQQTVKAFNCTAICPGYVPMDLTGAQFGVVNNPFYVAAVQDVRPLAGAVSTVDSGSSTSSGQNGVSVVIGTPSANSTFGQAINGQGSARVLISGTWTGTLTFEGSVDAGATWVAQPARVTGTSYTASSVTAKGMFLVDVAGLTNLRVRATAAMTGSAAVLFTFANDVGLTQLANPVRLFDNASGFLATINSSGQLNVNCAAGCSGGGGGGAITAASGAYAAGSLSAGAAVDGWSVTEGLTTDAAATAGGTGTFSAKFRLMTTQLAAINTTLGSPFQAGGSIGNTSFAATQPTAANLNATVVGTGTFAVQAAQSGAWTVNPATAANWGIGATGSAVPASGVYGTGRGQNAEPTAVGNGQQVGDARDLAGKTITSPYANRENMARGAANTTGTGAITIMAASGSASLKTYATDVECGRTDAGTSPIFVTLNDSASTVLVIPAGGGNNKSFQVPLVTAANTALTATAGTGVTTLYCNAQGFYGY